MEKYFMQLTPVNFNSDNKKTKQTSFKAYSTFIEPIIEDITSSTMLTTKNSRLLKKVEILIDEEWAKIKSKKLKQVTPEFVHKKSNNTIITLKPAYFGTQNEILVNVDKGEEIERVLIPRGLHNSYKYEKIKKTPYGSATVKTYNSNIQKDESMELHINSLLEESLANFFKNKRQ